MSSHAGSADHPSPFLQGLFRNDAQCAGCHSVQGFIQFVGTTPEDTTNIIPSVDTLGDTDALPIVCASCHDPHDASKEGSLRLEPANLCVKCHNQEDAQPGETVHHATSSMWEGSGAVEFAGFEYRNQSPHQLVEPTKSDACITCHVHMSPFVNDTIPAATGHTFRPRLEGCGVEGCHIDGFDEVGPASEFDFRSRQTLTDSLVNVLTGILTNASTEDSTTQTFSEALFNLQFVTSSGSRGVHNPFYAEDILNSTIEVARGAFSTAIEPISTEIPGTFLLEQNYPNPFNPTTAIEFEVPGRSLVKIAVYNALGQHVTTLVNEEMSPGRYKVDFSAANLSSGVYIYTLESGALSLTKTMTLLK